MRIAYCAPRIDWATLQRVEFYRQDWEALRALGHDTVFLTAPWQMHGHFDAAVMWWWNYQWLWGPVLRARRIPLLSVGVFDVDGYPSLSRHERWLKRWGYRYTSLHALCSRYEIDRVAAFGLPPERVRYCPLTVDADYYCPGAATAASTTLTIANVAWQRLTNLRRKMVPELLEAFAQLLPSVPAARLVLAGAPSDGTAWLRNRAAELGVADKVAFPGAISREDKRRLYRNCALYCQVSQSEGFGLATAEALACAAPVLASRVAAVPEVVRDHGTYVDELSVEGIRAGLARCLADLPACQARAREGSAFIRAEFSSQRHCHDFQTLLNELLANFPAATERVAETSAT